MCYQKLQKKHALLVYDIQSKSSAISENTSEIKSLILRENMRLLVDDIQGKVFVKARHFKKQSASQVKMIKNTRSPETAKF